MNMSLNSEQQRCYDAFLQGQSLVVTGPAGCGKSYLIRHITEYCENLNKHIAITALTGAAASLIGGVTLHSWAGIGLGKGSAQEIYNNMRRYRPLNIRSWEDVQVLIIDEISMMDATLFNKLHILAQIIRSKSSPEANTQLFGGIQLVLCGDFAQLKPIPNNGNTVKFAFESTIWQQYLNNSTFYLDKVIRQNDPIFCDLLNRLRMGNYTSEDKELLDQCCVTAESEANIAIELPNGHKQTIKGTRLYPKKKDVNRINQLELDKLIKKEKATYKNYICIDSAIHKKSKQPVKVTEHFRKTMNNCTTCNETLVLAIGAQVMLIKNMNVASKLVNGSRGVIVDFDNAGLPVVVFDHGEKLTLNYELFETETGEIHLIRKQIPLILAWALTIHKCQGATLSNVVTDLSEVFDESQVYVTLSRVQSLEGLFILGINYNKIKCNPKVIRYYESLSPQ